MISPPMVLRAHQVLGLMLSLGKWTEPSQKTSFTPPGRRLSAVKASSSLSELSPPHEQLSSLICEHNNIYNNPPLILIDWAVELKASGGMSFLPSGPA